jgi:LacI family transcriptional regulator
MIRGALRLAAAASHEPHRSLPPFYLDRRETPSDSAPCAFEVSIAPELTQGVAKAANDRYDPLLIRISSSALAPGVVVMPRTRRPTQTDIARAAGVSPAVVSLVVNGRADGKIRISQETQQRVRQAIRELGYVPNMAARQLAGGQNHLLGVFTYEPAFPLNVSNFYYPFIVGIEEQAEALGYDLLLFTRSADGTGRRQVFRDGVNALQKADGAILLGANEDRSELARLVSEGFPFVFAGRRVVNGKPLAYVGADYITATAEVVRLLTDHGHRDILYVGGPVLNESSTDRESGFRQGMTAAGLPIDDARIIRMATEDLDEAFVRTWHETGVTAFVAEGLFLAQPLIAAAGSIGLTPPQDFSIAALGNSGTEIVDDEGFVTSLYIPRREMGAGTVELLVSLLTAPDDVTSAQILLPCTVTPGATVGAPPA